jgi:hypothetical protein
MKPTANPIWRFLGFNTQGDLGGVTFYTSHDHGLVFFLATTPKKPQSARQRHQRNLFRLCAETWLRFSPEQRALWETASKRAGLRITGYNAWVHIQLAHDQAWYATLRRQTGITPPLAPSEA